LSWAAELVFADDALVPVRLALDPVFSMFARFGELSNNLVATLFAVIFAKRGRELQGLPRSNLCVAV